MIIEFLDLNKHNFDTITYDDRQDVIILRYEISRYDAFHQTEVGEIDMRPVKVILADGKKCFIGETCGSTVHKEPYEPNRKLIIAVVLQCNLGDFIPFNPLTKDCKELFPTIYEKYNKLDVKVMIKVFDVRPKFSIRRPRILIKGFKKGQVVCQTQ